MLVLKYILRCRAMIKNKFHPTDNDHVAHLGEIFWKIPVTPQVNTCDMRFILIIDGTPCLEREVQMISICHIVQWSGEAYFN